MSRAPERSFPLSKLYLPIIFLSILLYSSVCSSENYGGNLTIGYFGQIEELNPTETKSGIGGNLIDIVYDSLLEISDSDDLRPGISKHWSISKDRLQWTFHLRKNIQFHDGTPLTAKDVQTTYQEILEKENGTYFNFLKHIKDIIVVDEHTLKIELSQNDNTFPIALYAIGIAKNNGSYVGSGPFQLISSSSKEAFLKANLNHFKGRPYLDSITVKFFSTQRANLAALTSKEVDMLYIHDQNDYGILHNIDHIKIYPLKNQTMSMVFLNNSKDIFKDTLVRKALNYAIDNNKIIETILNGNGSAAFSFLNNENELFNHSITDYDYSPDKALELLNRAGWKNTDHILEKNGTPFEFTLNVIKENDLHKKVSRIIQQQLDEIGIRVNIELLPFNTLLKNLYNDKDYDAAIVSVNFRYNLFNNYSLWHSSQINKGSNFSLYKNSKSDKALDIARETIYDKIYREAYMNFQNEINNDPPVIFLFWLNIALGINKNFKNIPDNPDLFFKSLPNIWLEDRALRTEGLRYGK